jgi:hypothetical protein
LVFAAIKIVVIPLAALACRPFFHHIQIDSGGDWARTAADPEGSIMATELTFHRILLSALGASLLLLSGCVSAPGTYPDPNGPRNGEGLLVDPQTGVALPGQSDQGF